MNYSNKSKFHLSQLWIPGLVLVFVCIFIDMRQPSPEGAPSLNLEKRLAPLPEEVNEGVRDGEKNTNGNSQYKFAESFEKPKSPTDCTNLNEAASNPAFQELIATVFYAPEGAEPDIYTLIDGVEDTLRSDSKSQSELIFIRQALQRAALLKDSSESERAALIDKWQEVLEQTNADGLGADEQIDLLKSQLLFAQFAGDVEGVRSLYVKSRYLDPSWKGSPAIQAWLTLQQSNELDPWKLAQDLTTDEELRKLVIELPPS